MVTPKHYFLRHVPEHKRELVEACGFVPHTSADGSVVWVEPAVFTGPLGDIPLGDCEAGRGDDVERWLLGHGVAAEIFVTYKWGAGVD